MHHTSMKNMVDISHGSRHCSCPGCFSRGFGFLPYSAQVPPSSIFWSSPPPPLSSLHPVSCISLVPLHAYTLFTARKASSFLMFIEIWGHLWCQSWGLLGGQSGHKVVMGLVFGSVVRSVMGSFIKGSGLYISCMSQICPVV